MNPNITLTGFMGTGKSTIGRLVANQLRRNFVDMDTIIEQREQRPISQIFAKAGEPYFRQLEADLCHELAARSDLVIATGGGTLVVNTNLRLLVDSGPVICLDCAPEVLWQRIGHSEDRPMLAERDAGRFTRLGELLTARGPAYARVPHHIDVSHLAPEDAAERVIDVYKQALRVINVPDLGTDRSMVKDCG